MRLILQKWLIFPFSFNLPPVLTAGRDRSTEEERRGVWLGVWAVYVKITYQKLKFSFGGKNVNMYFTFIQTIFKTISNMNTFTSVIYLY